MSTGWPSSSLPSFTFKASELTPVDNSDTAAHSLAIKMRQSCGEVFEHLVLKHPGSLTKGDLALWSDLRFNTALLFLSIQRIRHKIARWLLAFVIYKNYSNINLHIQINLLRWKSHSLLQLARPVVLEYCSRFDEHLFCDEWFVAAVTHRERVRSISIESPHRYRGRQRLPSEKVLRNEFLRSYRGTHADFEFYCAKVHFRS